MEFLIKSTEISIYAAKSSNPLTGLPGNVIIQERMKNVIEEQNSYTVMYLDIDNFKAFNDVYGFEMGDDFVVILNNHNVQRYISKIEEKDVGAIY